MYESAGSLETPKSIFARVLLELAPRSRLPEVQVEFCRFANANSFIRLADGRLHARITDVLQSSPPPVLEALAYILISKLFRKSVPAGYVERYRRYMNRKEMRNYLDQVRQTRGHKLTTAAKGVQYDLEEIFDELNFRYFFGLMARPALGWSLRRSRTTLGHYDRSHNTIVISRILDEPRFPRLAVEYVMFHEMLHLVYPVDHSGKRRCVHTPEFKKAEKKFAGYEEAKALLKKL